MDFYQGRHPVFVSHTKELEQMLYFTGDLQYRCQLKHLDNGEAYKCLLRVRQKCADLLLRMYAEDSEIILLTSCDYRWVRLIVDYVRNVVLKSSLRTG